MIQIQAPNGELVEFPDGTDDATMTKAMQAAYGSQQSSSPTDTAIDTAKSVGVGALRAGAGLLGLPEDIRRAGQAGVDWLTTKAGLRPADAAPSPSLPVGSSDILAGVENVAGPLYKPQTTSGEYARTVGEFGAGMLGGPGSLVRRLLMQVVSPAVASETAGQATKGTAAEPYARVGGAVFGSLLPLAASRAVTPLPSDPVRQGMVNTLRNEGVTDLTAGQATGRKGLQFFESEMGGLGAGRLADSSADQFTAAALRRAGENAPRALPDVVDRAFTRIGQQFDDLASRNTMAADQQLVNDMRGAVGEYYNLVSPPNRTPAVTNFAEELVTKVSQNNGTLPGDVYQSLRSRMERAARSMGNNPEARNALRELREAIDDNMERSLVAAGNTADLGAWREARNQWRNMLVIEKAATGAGSETALGHISPSQLRQAAVNQGRRAYARGEGDFADLARAGEAIMKPLPQSGTAPRVAAHMVPSMLGGAAGGAATDGDWRGMLLGAIAPRALGALSMSGPGRAYLGNQAMAGANLAGNARTSVMLDALMLPRLQQQPSR